jgi:DNA-binding IclR family transcriptional regulator
MVTGVQDERAAGGVQSAEVALRILRVLAENGGDLSLSRLAAAAQMAPAKAHRYVVSLMRAGFVEQAGRSATYTLGGEALRVGLVALARLDIVGLGTEAAAELRDRTGQTVLLAIWGEHGPTIVRWFEPAEPVTVNVRIGSVMPLVSSATGQVFAAWMPRDRVLPLVEAELRAPGAAVSSAEEAQALFEAVRERGLSSVSGSMLPGIQALGAPVLNADAELSAALTVLGTEGSFDRALGGVVAGELRAVAQQLSHRLGFGANSQSGKGQK